MFEKTPTLPMDFRRFLSIYKNKLSSDEDSELKSKPRKMAYFAGNIMRRTELDYKLLMAMNASKNIKEAIQRVDRNVVGNPLYDCDAGFLKFSPGDHVAYRFEILKALGKGSFAQVVKCIDHSDPDLPTVALKIVRNTEIDSKMAQEESQCLQNLMNDDT